MPGTKTINTHYGIPNWTKILWLIPFILVSVGCSIKYKLNTRVHKSQKECINNSPFRGASEKLGILKIQRKYRLQCIAELDSLISHFPNDTLILVERYTVTCINCSAHDIGIYVDTLYVNYNHKNLGDYYYCKTVNPIDSNFMDFREVYHWELIELFHAIQKSDSWHKHPESFGDDNCDDGGYSFYTVIYPDGKMLSMYMRCWTKWK